MKSKLAEWLHRWKIKSFVLLLFLVALLAPAARAVLGLIAGMFGRKVVRETRRVPVPVSETNHEEAYHAERRGAEQPRPAAQAPAAGGGAPSAGPAPAGSAKRLSDRIRERQAKRARWGNGG